MHQFQDKMAGVSKNTVSPSLKGVQFSESKMAEVDTECGLQWVQKVSVQFIAKYLVGENSDLATEVLMFGATGYL